VGGVTSLLGGSDISKSELIQAGFVSGGAYAVNGKEDSPRDEPNGKKDLGHHSQVANEEVSVHSIGALDVVIVCSVYR